jgi:anti-sigma-K factor RskA
MSGSETEALGPLDLAAEYVLGTLEADEAEEARNRLETMPDFAAEVRFWESRLQPLTVLVAPVPPPAWLWPRIEDSTGGASGDAASSPSPLPRPANDNRLVLWRTTALVGLALAASLAAFIAVRPPAMVAVRPAASEFAVLTPLTNAAAPVLVAVSGPGGSLYVRPASAVQVAAGRDMELWSLPTGASRPASLGVLPAGGKPLPAGIAPGTKLLVSLEPKGGSPTGQPTGTVIYGGTVQRID